MSGSDAPDDAPFVDVTLIDEMLALTPDERLRLNDRMLRTIEELRDAFAQSGTDHAAHGPGGSRD